MSPHDATDAATPERARCAWVLAGACTGVDDFRLLADLLGISRADLLAAVREGPHLAT